MHEGSVVIVEEDVWAETLSKERKRSLLRQDEQKILTGRTPEMTIEDGNGSFVEFFGLNQSMKVFLKLLGSEINADGGLWLNNKGTYHYNDRLEITNFLSTTDLCLENARLRKQVRSDFPELDTTEIEAEVVYLMINRYSPGLINKQEALTRVQQERPDHVLVVGDPWHVTNKHLDEPRIQTIDYEEGAYAGYGNTETIGEITSELDLRLGPDQRPTSHRGALDEMEYAWDGVFLKSDDDVSWLWDNSALPDNFSANNISYKKVEEEVDWFTDRALLGTKTLEKMRGSTPPEDEEGTIITRIVSDGYSQPIEEVRSVFQKIVAKEIPVKKVGVTFLVGIAERLSQELKTDSSSENLAAAQQAWEVVKEKLEQNPRHGKKIDYDTSYGLHPIDNLLKTLNLTSNTAAQRINVLQVYRDEIFPNIIREHLEDLADIHVNAVVDGSAYDQDGLIWYRSLWNDFLVSKDIDPEKYRYHDPNSRFVDLLSDFFLLHGIRIVGELNPDFLEQVEAEKKEKIMEKFPPPKYEQEARFTEMMFPQTQSLPAHSKDRIIMSWSWSAHMLQTMTEEELVGVVWPELDRLLANGGLANIFPIGHHGVDHQWVLDTVNRYVQETGAKWQVSMDRQVSHVVPESDYRLLQIRKLS